MNKINKETNSLLERFSVNETGLLVFKEKTSIDKKRFGSNIQPKTSDEARNSDFLCNGCRQGNDEISPRYICTGCRREPNHEGDYVDFCHKCANALAGSDEEKRKSVLNESVGDGHEEWHALLRVNFGPEGYYNY